MDTDEEADRPAVVWPDVPRICFGPGEPRQFNANLSWVLGSHELGNRTYVLGYLRAAEALFEHSTDCTASLSPDYMVFPLAFLWRHYVELALKEIITLGRELQCEFDAEFPTHHRLAALWETSKPYIAEYGSPDAPELANVEANINELQRIDPYATGFRYLLDREQESLGLADPPSSVNLGGLQNAMVAVSNFFEAVNSCQSAALDHAQSSDSYMR